MPFSGPGDADLAVPCGAAVHIEAEAVTAAEDDIEVEGFGSGCECARKAARKFPRKGLCVGMADIKWCETQSC